MPTTKKRISKNKGNIFIISAPSGAGKTTLCRMILEQLDDIEFSISYTTRPPRPGEVDGRDYYFVSKDEFMQMVQEEEFIEWAEVHGNLYGTSKKRLLERVSKGIDVLLDIDTQGAAQIKEKGLEAVYIFILPPSLSVLRERLEGRASDSEDVINRRLKKAVEEIAAYKMYNYVIINDKLDEAFELLKAVVLSKRVAIESIDTDWIEETFLKG
ncbi:MAG: guanylate kinase [Nitrospirae bacterium]|nr:guanylate kinase [Nitrospirota bacterium]